MNYQTLPTSPRLVDRRQDPVDYPYWLRNPPRPAPYQAFPEGPGLPPSSSGADLPTIGAHLPISPGDPGWTPPPSPSGPHNVRGDPPRPGYDRPSFPIGPDSPSQYELAPVDGDPFGGGRVGYDDGGGVTDFGDSPSQYELEPVGHDPFAASIADKYITRAGQPVAQPTAPSTASMVADKYTSGAQISDPEWMRYQEDNAQAEQRNAEWGAATETFHPQTMGFIGRTGGTLPSARSTIRQIYPSGPSPDDPEVMQRAYSDLIGRRNQFSGSPVSQGARGGLADIGFGGSPLMAPRLVTRPAAQLSDPYERQFQAPPPPPEEGGGFARGGGLSLIDRPFYRAGLSG